MRDGWLLPRLGGKWSLLAASPIAGAPLPVVVLETTNALQKYGLTDGGVYLVRPDHYIAARWKRFSFEDLMEIPWPI